MSTHRLFHSSAKSHSTAKSRAASLPTRVLAQARFETVTMIRNGEQFLLLVILPLMALVGLHMTSLLEPFVPAGNTTLDVAVPGVLVLCVISSAFSGQGIQTGFDRRYGVLRHAATTPLGRTGLVAGKLLAILAVLALQFGLICTVATLLGWRPGALAVVGAIPILVLTATAFTGLGLLIAGTLRAEATLAVLNLVWVVVAVGGGVLFPVTAMPAWISWLVHLLPSAQAGEALRAWMLHDAVALTPLLGLAVWSVASWLATLKWFKWA